MGKGTDGWMDGEIDEMDKGTNGWVGGWIDVEIDMNERRDKCMDGWVVDGWTDA